LQKKTSIFIKKIILNAGTGMGRGYPNPSGMGMGFTFSSPLDMGRVTSKYMRIGYGDGECKTRPHPAPLPCLIFNHYISWKKSAWRWSKTALRSS